MDISPLFFYVFAGLAVACSLMVVLKKNPVSSAFSLVLVFFAFAGIYAILDAHLIAALQVLVYAGAIMVLFIFVIMLLNADMPSFDLGRSHIGLRIAASAGALVLLAMFVWAFKNSAMVAPVGRFSAEAIENNGGNTRVVSQLMFSEYILPFELTSVLLLGAIVGAVAIAKRGKAHQFGPGRREIYEQAGRCPMMGDTVELWVVLSFCAAIFFIGLTGVLIRRNVLVILMSIELMLNAVNLTFVAFSKQLQDMGGQMSVFFIITVAAAESAVGLGLVIAMFRTLRSVDTDEIQLLRE